MMEEKEITGQEQKVTERKMRTFFLFPNSHRLPDGGAYFFLISFFPAIRVGHKEG